MDFCFAVESNRVKNPYKGKKWIVPLKSKFTSPQSKLIPKIKTISFDDLIEFLWELPLDAETSQTHTAHTNPKIIKIFLSKNDSIIIDLDYDNAQCTMRFIWKSGMSPPPKYLAFNQRNDRSIICTFKKRIDDPYAAAIEAAEKISIKHPFRVIGKKLIQYLKNTSTVEFVIQHAYCEEKKKSIQQPKIPFTLEFFKKLNGFTRLFSIENEAFPTIFSDDISEKRLHSLIYLDNDFHSIIAQADFIEIDASFEVFSPYVFSIPTAIISNESFPLGFSIGPTENIELYENFYNLVHDIDVETFEKLVKLPVLSDEGTALQAFCKKFEITQFFCFRHIIEKFGANSQIAVIVRKLLFIEDKLEFYHYWNSYIQMITGIFLDSNTDNQNRFKKLFNTQYDSKTGILTSPNFDNQALWTRGPMHIATSTNHVESGHQKLNCKTRHVRKFMKKIQILLEYICNRKQKASKRPNLKKLIQKISRPLHDECKKELIFLQQLYNIPKIPCQHEIGTIKIPDDIQIHYDSSEVTDRVQLFQYSGKWIFSKSTNPFLNFEELSSEDKSFVEIHGMPNEKIFQYITKDLVHKKNIKITQKELLNSFIHFNGLIFKEYKYEYCEKFIHYIFLRSFDIDESEEFIHELQKGNLAKIQKASPNIDYEEDFPDENQSIESLEKMKEKITEYIDYMKKHELIQSCRTLDEIKEELKKTILNF